MSSVERLVNRSIQSCSLMWLRLLYAPRSWRRDRRSLKCRSRGNVPPLSRMTGTQKKLLFGDELPESDEAGAEFLAGQLEQAVSFWFDEDSPLRRLTGAETCYCELPFHMMLSLEDESWGFLQERLDCREPFKAPSYSTVDKMLSQGIPFDLNTFPFRLRCVAQVTGK